MNGLIFLFFNNTPLPLLFFHSYIFTLGNNIGDAGMTSLSEALNVNESLTELHLSGNTKKRNGEGGKIVCSHSQAFKKRLQEIELGTLVP